MKGCLKMMVWIFVIYLVLGAMAPFIVKKDVTDKKKAQQAVKDLGQDRESVDRAQILETNQSAWDERIRLLNQAEESIILSTFDMRDEQSTRDILSVIYQKAEEGTDVKIMVDGISGFLRMKYKPVFKTVAAHPNIEIRFYNPINIFMPWKSQGRMHDKYVIVDHMGYILGGRNSFDYFIGEYPTKHKSYDREVLVYNEEHKNVDEESSSIYELEDYFEQVWDSGRCATLKGNAGEKKKNQIIDMLNQRYEDIVESYPELFEEYDYTKHTVETKGVSLLANPIGIYGKEPVVFYQLLELMGQAKEQVVIHTPYLVLNSYMKEELKSVNEQVPVTIMINGAENGDNVMATSDYLLNQRSVFATEVKLLEYIGGTSLHGKSVAIDQEIAIIGSYNFDLRSTYVDTELMVAIRGTEITEQLLDNMDNLHVDCRTVEKEGVVEMPQHLNVSKPPLVKKVLWKVLGVVMQPFRVLV